MAERLTECIDSHLLDNGEMVKEYSLNSKIKLNHFSAMDVPNAVYDKLGELEDILEKYGIESVEELDYLLEVFKKMRKQYGKLNQENCKNKKDRDAWKRACELACGHIAEVEWLSCPETDDISKSENEIRTLTKQALNHFYQQAKQVAGKLPANKRENK